MWENTKSNCHRWACCQGLRGTIPPLPASIQSFNIDRNQFTGTIPALPPLLTIL